MVTRRTSLLQPQDYLSEMAIPPTLKKCCVYCKGDHCSASCEQVNTMVDRREVLLKEGCCFLCLTSGHRANQCSSNQKCRKCNQKHHQSLCEQGTTLNTEGENKSDTVPKATVAVGKVRLTYCYRLPVSLLTQLTKNLYQ